MTKSPVSILSVTKRDPNRDISNIILLTFFIMLFVSNILPIDFSVIYSNNMGILIYCIIYCRYICKYNYV